MQRRAALAFFVVSLIGAAVVFAMNAGGSDSKPNAAPAVGGTTTTPASGPKQDSTTTTAPKSTSSTVPLPPAVDRPLSLMKTITGEISPKSVVASDGGLVFAQNMMYRHTVTVYDDTGKLVKTIPDGVDLAKFGYDGHPGVSQGAPVEGAISPDHRFFYVTNYSMYGANFGPEGSDECGGPSGLSPSYVYKIDVKTLEITGVAEVGMVPKYVAVTPDNRYILATNWCSFDLSVIDRATFKEVQRIPLGNYPRGIVVNPSSTTAYVAVMGSSNIARVDLNNFGVGWYYGVGQSPRHVVLSPDGRYLYATLNGENHVIKLDTTTGNVVSRVETGSQPRSMSISKDGTALYVVNYLSNTVSKLRASDMSVVQNIGVPSNPIGITFEPGTHRVWVACYSGEILVFNA